MKKIFAAAIFSAVLMISGMAAASEAEAVKLLNELRVEVGLPALAWDSQSSLQRAAEVRARELEEKFSHTRPDGTSCFSIFPSYNVSYMAAGENIAAGQTSPEEVMNSWMHSSGHKANILNGRFGHIGVGLAQGGSYGYYWVQMFTN